MNMKLRNIPFSPPDMTEAEAKEVREVEKNRVEIMLDF